MKYFLTLLFLTTLTLLESQASTYVLKAGQKKVVLDMEKTEWSDFCLKENFGCARFYIGENKKPSSFGFIKALSDKSSSMEELKSFCHKTFEQTKKIVPDIRDFSFHTNGPVTYCSWSSSTETTILTYKESITLMVSVSDKSLTNSLLAMLNRAKLHEKP
jgi:hypothetical protein